VGFFKQKIIVITGPTASGKSSVAIELARLFDGEIVNADSMQVYRGMDVGTAKLPVPERKGIPHHLIDVVNPDEEFNAAIYQSKALPLMEGMAARGKLPFVVGGTGLYIKTLLCGLLDHPHPEPGLRESLLKEWEQHGSYSLRESLKSLDPESAQRIHPHDKVRILRALEIIRLTGKPLSSLIRKHGFREKLFVACKICLQMEREHLYHRINARTVAMIEEGLPKETETLLGKGYSPELKPMKSLGYRQMVKYLAGEWSLNEAVSQLKRDTRRYAKRQLTWFRGDPEMLWMDPENLKIMTQKIREFIGGPTG
jgi:tRNA dimethylallyltransferase